MKSIVRVAAFGFLMMCVCASLAAEQSQSLLAKPGKLLFEDDFARADMAPKWKVGKGTWTVKDGVVSAAENPEDKHAAYAYITPKVEYKDAVVEFQFHFDGAKSIQLNMRDSKYKLSHAGHIVRVQIQPTSVQLADWKTGVMANENYAIISDKTADPAKKKEINQKIKDKTTSYKVSFDASKWHTARVEVAGDEMLLSIDGKPVGYLKSEGVAHPTKNMLGITVGGKTGQVKDVKFWDATPNPDWASSKSAVLDGLKK